MRPAEMNRSALSLPARGLTGAAGLALIASLFATWSRMSLQQLALLAVSANGDLGRLSLSVNAWDVYAGVAAALTVVGLLRSDLEPDEPAAARAAGRLGERRSRPALAVGQCLGCLRRRGGSADRRRAAPI